MTSIRDHTLDPPERSSREWILDRIADIDDRIMLLTEEKEALEEELLQ